MEKKMKVYFLNKSCDICLYQATQISDNGLVNLNLICPCGALLDLKSTLNKVLLPKEKSQKMD